MPRARAFPEGTGRFGMKNKKGVIASIHSTATQWQHKFMMEITFEKCLMVLSGILSGSKSYGKESLVIVPRKDINNNKFKKIKKFFFNKEISINIKKFHYNLQSKFFLENIKFKINTCSKLVRTWYGL